jgi:hypothetical protein
VHVQTSKLRRLTQSAQPIARVSQADSPVASPVTSPEKLPNRPNLTSSDVRDDLEDWRTPMLRYLRDPSAKVDKSVCRVLSSMCCIMMNSIEEPPKIYC